MELLECPSFGHCQSREGIDGYISLMSIVFLLEHQSGSGQQRGKCKNSPILELSNKHSEVGSNADESKSQGKSKLEYLQYP